MTDASNLPLALYKANLELWLRIGQLLEDNREQWTGVLAQELDQRMAEAGRSAGDAGAAPGWQSSLAMMPGNELWRLAEQQVSDLQALAQTASGNQMTFVNGFQQALEEWQQATAGAFGEAATGVELPAQPFQGLHDTFEQLSNALLSGMGALATPAAAAPRTGTVDARRPAAKKAPVRKVAKTSSRPATRATRRATKKSAARSVSKTPVRKATKKATKKTVKKAARKTAARPAKKAAKRAPRKAAAR